jgi:hypothetical protein
VKRTINSLVIGVLAATATAGCTKDAPHHATVPPPGPGLVQTDPLAKPMPGERDESALPKPFDDKPLLNQQAPEQRDFLAAYERVGRPRIAVLINRTPDSAGPFTLPDGKQSYESR